MRLSNLEINDFIKVSLTNGQTVEGRVALIDEEGDVLIIRPQMRCRNYSTTLETFDADVNFSLNVNIQHIVYWRKLTASEIQSSYQLLIKIDESF